MWGKYISRSKILKSNPFEVLSFTMYDMQLGPKTQLSAYIGNRHNFYFDLLANTSQYQSPPSTHPVLAVISKCG